MPAAYVIAEIDVKDPEGYKNYTSATPGVVAKFGGEFVVRGGATESKEGEAPRGRIVVIRFPNLVQANAFYHSDDYAELLALRISLTDSRLFVVEGAN